MTMMHPGRLLPFSALSRWWLVVVGLLGTAGCGSGVGEIHPAAGTIQFEDGTPLPEGTDLELLPLTEGDAGFTVSGAVFANGQFELETMLPGGKCREGAPAGRYKVILFAVDSLEPRPADTYLDAAQTPLQVEIGPGRDNQSLRLTVTAGPARPSGG